MYQNYPLALIMLNWKHKIVTVTIIFYLSESAFI